MQNQVDSSLSILTLVELRVLEGLSRGASLPLDEALTIGHDDSSDLLLMDDGVAPSHARITPVEGGFLLEVNGTSGETSSARQLALGEAFALGAARLVCCSTDTPWDALFAAAPPSPTSDAVKAPGSRLTLRSRRLRLLVGLLTALILTAALLTWLVSQDIAPAPATATATHDAPHAVVDLQTLGHWARDIEHRLQVADLSALETDVHQGAVRISGAVPGTALPRLEQVLKTARRERPDIRIVLQLKEALPEPLPFRVKALVGGPYPRVLLDDHHLLYPGDRHAGVFLIAINGTCLTLMQEAEQQKTQVCLDQIRRPS